MGTRKKEESLESYIQKGKDFIEYEKSNIESFEILANCRQFAINDQIGLFIRYFKNEKYYQRADCLIHLYNFLEMSKKEFMVNMTIIFEYTVFRFTNYGKILEERGLTIYDV